MVYLFSDPLGSTKDFELVPLGSGHVYEDGYGFGGLTLACEGWASGSRAGSAFGFGGHSNIIPILHSADALIWAVKSLDGEDSVAIGLAWPVTRIEDKLQQPCLGLLWG